MADEWRVEVELSDPGGDTTLRERLQTLALDPEARRRLDETVIVTHDGVRSYLYATGAERAEEAERVARELLEQQGLEARIDLRRWHPVEGAWKDAAIPLPETEAERQVEYARLEAAEAREVEEEGEFDWQVRAELPSHAETVALAARLQEEGLQVVRRWRYLLVGALTERAAEELADDIRAAAPGASAVTVEAVLSRLSHPLYVFFEQLRP